MLSLLELSMEVESGLKTKKELPSKLLPKTAKFVSSKEHGSTFMTNLCLSMRDGFIKLSHMKVICGRSRHTRRNRLNAAPMKFVQSWRNLSFRVLMKFVHIQNKSVFHASINTLFTAQAPCKFVHSHTRIPCHHEHEPDSIIHAMLNGLPTFFMAEKTSERNET